MPPNLLLTKFLALFYAFFQVPGQTPVGIFANGVANPPSSGMTIWWQADQGNNCAGPCSNGSSQSSWADQSGSGNNGTLTPAITSACVASVYNTNQINGKPAVTFNGNNTVGSETCFSIGNAGVPIAWSGGVTEFSVVKFTGVSGTSYTITSGGAGVFSWSHGGGAQLQNSSKACNAALGTGTASFDTNWHQMNTTYNSSTGAWAFRLDRANDNSGTNAQTMGSTFLVLGTDPCGGGIRSFLGQIAEFILYNRVLSAGEITTVETYLNSRYAL